MKKQFLITLILFVSLSLSISAQNNVADWGVGFSIGKTQYDGDRGSNMFFGNPYNQHIGFRVGRYINPLLDVKLAGGVGKVGADDGTLDGTFDVNMLHANLAVHANLSRDTRFNPFVSAGIGYASFSGSARNATDDSGMTIPLGAGLKWNLSDDVYAFYHGQYNLYSGDEYDNFVADGNDRHFIHELGLNFNLGKEDRDGDKVADSKDACPDTPGLKEYDGCPDSDLDGIIDGEDDCPMVAGLAEYRGCPDTDGDGIIDGDDACPEVAGDAMYAGCPDTDGDGIGDNLDECPEESGVSKYNGCPVPDTDGDGFDDDNDNCINTPGDLNGCPDRDDDGTADKDDGCPDTPGSINAYGCPDGDGDGVADKDDECPEEAGLAELNGCPKVRKPTPEEIINSYESPHILFERGTVPAEGYQESIDSIVQFANDYPNAYLNIGGYSDSQGSESSNMRISQRRARKVYDSLVKAGVDPERLTYEGYGEADPVADNSTPEGRKLNRRAVVTASTVKREIDTGGKR